MTLDERLEAAAKALASTEKFVNENRSQFVKRAARAAIIAFQQSCPEIEVIKDDSYGARAFGKKKVIWCDFEYPPMGTYVLTEKLQP